MSAAVDEILHRIEQLPNDDRLELEERLAILFQAEWSEQIAQARAEAKQRGIDDLRIDEAVARVRYGR